MPGFLEVYGYYSPELKKWNIDVSPLHPIAICWNRIPSRSYIIDADTTRLRSRLSNN